MTLGSRSNRSIRRQEWQGAEESWQPDGANTVISHTTRSQVTDTQDMGMADTIVIRVAVDEDRATEVVF